MQAGAAASAGAGAQEPGWPLRPLTLMQLMPSLNGIVTESAKRTYTAQKPPNQRQTNSAVPYTVEKMHIFTLAELKASKMFSAVRTRSPAVKCKPPLSAKKPKWNSSVKRDNKRTFLSTTTLKDIQAGQSKHAAVRKVLDFRQAKPKVVPCNIPRLSMKHTFASPKRLKHDQRSNGILKHLNRKSINRISGVCKFADTPLVKEKKVDKVVRMKENKENIPTLAKKVDKKIDTQENNTRRSNLTERPFKEQTDERNIHDESYRELCIKNETAPLTAIPSPSDSTTNSDISFLQREKEICNNTIEKQENLVTESPIISTPFKAYRNVHEYFNESSDFDISVQCTDSTLMHLDRERSSSKLNISAEESDIASLCDLMDKAKFSNIEKIDKSEGDLMKMQAELVQEIERLKKQRSLIDESLSSHEKMLKTIIKLLNRNDRRMSKATALKTPSNIETSVNFDYAGSKSCKPALQRSPKSPTFIIPKRTPCLRRNVLHKSMPKDLNVEIDTPTGKSKSRNRALNIYMKMKQQCKFLMTPVGNKRPNKVSDVPNTPALTSMNLQNQLDRLYNGTP